MDPVQLGLKDFLTAAAHQNWGPTRTARNAYLWFHGLASAYNWIATNPFAMGRHDGWNWGRCHRAALTDDIDWSPWLGFTIAAINANFITEYDPDELLGIAGVLTDAQRGAYYGNEWKMCFQTWLKYREADGSKSTEQPILANGPLDVATPTTAVAEPYIWSPLKIGPKTQKYLAPYCKDITSSCLAAEDDTAVIAVAAACFPSETARKAELAELVGISGKLSDVEKITAEFWAGGPNTVSPPGMFIWFWKEYMKVINPDIKLLVKSGLSLAIHLFETARLVWGCKLQFMQARPIQEIRLRYGSEVIKNWNGTGPANLWVPYQTASFVTPPFPDFPSGHSAFSQSFANVMNQHFGPEIVKGEAIVRRDIELLSPLFKKDQTNVFGRIAVAAGASEIHRDVIPRGAIQFSWMKWSHMANSAGISRKYGGIHCTSAHIGSQKLANELHRRLAGKMFF